MSDDVKTAYRLRQIRQGYGLGRSRLARKSNLDHLTLLKAESGLPVSTFTIKQIKEALSAERRAFGLKIKTPQIKYSIASIRVDPVDPWPFPDPEGVDPIDPWPKIRLELDTKDLTRTKRGAKGLTRSLRSRAARSRE